MSQTFLVIFIKNKDGLYTDVPQKNPDAEFIPEISAKKLMEKDQDDLVIERPCLDIIENSEEIKSVRIINGMVQENITKALTGEHAGAVIYKQG